ncbi:MAG: hypothetical protein IJ184_07350 [Alphaproteobacteria bacterium]|nr:hypothetical protein [Alphaproteobacteria bacterium]
MNKITLDEQIRCVQREITYREYVYPNLCARGKMTVGTKEKEIATMQAVLATLKNVKYDEDAKPFDF